jgi:hypothetical protein
MFNSTIRAWLYCAAALAAAAFFLIFFVPDARAQTSGVPTGAIITGNSTGSTSAVTGTLAARTGVTTYICGFNVSAVGGAATVGPITVAGLVGSSQVYQAPVNGTAPAPTVAAFTFYPCIPASAPNTAITVTTTANGTASAVNVNSWGFQQ